MDRYNDSGSRLLETLEVATALSRVLIHAAARRNDGTCGGNIEVGALAKRVRVTSCIRRMQGGTCGPESGERGSSTVSRNSRNPSLKGMRLDCRCPVPLAVQVYPEPCTRPSETWDWRRYTSRLGRRATSRHRGNHSGISPEPIESFDDDRLVCAMDATPARDSSTHGKKKGQAKQRLEKAGWGTIRSTSQPRLRSYRSGDAAGLSRQPGAI